MKSQGPHQPRRQNAAPSIVFRLTAEERLYGTELFDTATPQRANRAVGHRSRTLAGNFNLLTADVERGGNGVL